MVLILVEAVLAICSLVLEYGFLLSRESIAWVDRLDCLIIAVFVLELAVMGFAEWRTPRFWRSYIFLVFLLGLQFILLGLIDALPRVSRLMESVRILSIMKVYILLAQFYLYVVVGVRAVEGRHSFGLLKITPAQLLVSSYALVISVGTFFLLLPRSQVQPWSVSFTDSLFTATSAVCVTGLITVDTAAVWSVQGKVIILGLIQVGGLGIMTYAVAFALLLGQDLGLRERALIQDILSVKELGKIGGLLVSIVGVTILAESLGAALLFGFWRAEMGSVKALGFAFFHAVSGFCNAGFSLFSENLAECRGNAGGIVTVGVLIVLGGLGFTVLMELFERRRWMRTGGENRVRFTVQTKIVFLTSLILITGGTAGIHVFEAFGVGGVRGLDAFFQSLTARTAGFNTIDISACQTSTQFLLMILMWIGASPGSTGGGLKTVTVALVLLSLLSNWRGRPHTELGHRILPDQTLKSAHMLMAIYLMVLVVGTLALTVTETAPFKTTLFEALSAMGTVGLSLGLTPRLSPAGKYIILSMMIFGRIGLLALLLMLGQRAVGEKYSYPEENVMLS